MGSDPQTRCICTCTRAEHGTLVSTSSSRAPFQHRSSNNADSSSEMIASRYRTVPADTPFFFYLLLFYAEAVRWATRRENDHEPRVPRDVTWWWIPRVRASLAGCRTFRGSLSVFVDLSMKPRSREVRGTLFRPHRLIDLYSRFSEITKNRCLL